jgi:hypothetical protein
MGKSRMAPAPAKVKPARPKKRGRPPEPGSLTNAEHQMLHRARQKDEVVALRQVIAVVCETYPAVRQALLEAGFKEVIERAEAAVERNSLT